MAASRQALARVRVTSEELSSPSGELPPASEEVLAASEPANVPAASVAPPPPPVYYAPAPTCYFAPGAPVWDQWRGIWVRPQVRVCN